MATNRIMRSVNLGTISKAGQQIILEAALETQNWTRPESVLDKDKLMKLVQDTNTALPAGTKTAVVR